MGISNCRIEDIEGYKSYKDFKKMYEKRMAQKDNLKSVQYWKVGRGANRGTIHNFDSIVGAMRNTINRDDRFVTEDLTNLKRNFFIAYFLETDEFESSIYRNDVQ